MSLPNTTDNMQAADQIQQSIQASAPNVPDTQTADTAAPSSPTTQGTPDVKGSPDNAAGVPQTPQGQPQPGGQPQGQDQSQQPQQGGPKLPAASQLPATANPNDPADHPAVQKAGVIRAIAQTLAGGPNVSYSIDANTGKMTATQQPLSKGQIGMAIAMAALSGGLSGLAENGPGATGRAAEVAFQKGQEQQQLQEQQQKQQATQDYARAAAITQTNFQTHQNALRLSQMDYDYHKQFIGDAAPVLSNINAVGAALENGVHESDLLTKYHVTKDMAIPDGIVENGKNPDGSTHWENTYTVIDPSKKIALPEDTAKLLADLRIPGYFDTDKDGKATPKNFAGSAQIRAGLVVNGLAVAQGFNITEAQLNKQFAGLKDGDKDQAEFDANLRTAISKGDVTAKGLQVIGNFAGLPIDKAVEAMEKAKVDPSIIGQYQKLVPADAMEQAKQKRIADEAKAKAQTNKEILEPNKNNYEQVLANPKDYSPQQIAAAQSVGKQVQTEKARDAFLAGSEHEEGVIAAKKRNGIPLGDSDSFSVSDPHLANLVTPQNIGPDGINHVVLDAMQKTNPQRAALVQAIANGQRLESFYGLAKKDGQALAADVQAVDPSFDQSKVQGWNNFVSKEMTPGGKVGSRVVAANTALNHLDNLVHNVGWLNSMAQGVKGADLIHIPGYAAVKADKEGLSTEVAKYYKGASPDKEAMENLNKVLSGNPENVKDGAKELAKLLHGGLDSLYTEAEVYRPSDHVKMPAFITPKGAASYKAVTGEDLDPSLLGSGHTQSNATQGNLHPQVTPPAGAVGTMKSADGTTHYVNAQRQSLGLVPSQ